MSIHSSTAFPDCFLNKPKLESSDIEELISILTPIASATVKKLNACIEQLSACYTGSLNKIDALSRRPLPFIGPLEQEPLPDSPERRAMWLASLSFSQKEFFEFISKIPDIEQVQEKLCRHIIFFLNDPEEETGKINAAKRDCFDEVLEKESLYLEAAKTSKAYGKLRALAFERRNIAPFFKKMGYRQVQKGSVGDVIVYFTNTSSSKKGPLPSYIMNKRPGHYGRVVEVRPDGAVIVESKFDKNRTYRHRMDLVPYFFGNSYLFFSKK